MEDETQATETETRDDDGAGWQATSNGETVNVPIREINRSAGDLQAREKLSREVIEAYKQAYMDGDQLPPIRLFLIDGRLYLVDGYHREAAQRALGYEEATATIELGTMPDAMLAAARANATHGARRTKGDARKAAVLAIRALTAQRGTKKKRPTVDEIVEIAKVGRSTAEAAFADLESAGFTMGPKDKRGRKATVHTESETEYQSGEEGGEDGEDITPAVLMERQAGNAKQNVTDLAATVRRYLSAVDSTEIANPGSRVRLAWIVVATELEAVANDIRERLGVATAGGEEWSEAEADAA